MPARLPAVQTGVSIYAGATVELVGCESTSNTLAGVEVREPGTTLTAIDCKLSQNSQVGVGTCVWGGGVGGGVCVGVGGWGWVGVGACVWGGVAWGV